MEEQTAVRAQKKPVENPDTKAELGTGQAQERPFLVLRRRIRLRRTGKGAALRGSFPAGFRYINCEHF